MENFFYQDEFYGDVEDLLNALEIEEDQVANLPDEWQIECMETNLEPVFVFDIDWLMGVVRDGNEERFSEESNEDERIEKLMKANINFAAINEKMPKLYYPGGEDFTITKKDLLEFISPQTAG